MITKLSPFVHKTDQKWPLGLNIADIVKDLANIKSPEIFKSKLEILQQNNLLDKVLGYGTNQKHTSLLELLLTKKRPRDKDQELMEIKELNRLKSSEPSGAPSIVHTLEGTKKIQNQEEFEKIQTLVNYGALNFFTTTSNGKSPLELLYKKTRSNFLHLGRGNRKYRLQINQLALSMLRNQDKSLTDEAIAAIEENEATTNISFRSLKNLAGSKHPIYYAIKQIIREREKITPQTVNNSPDVQHSWRDLFAVKQALALGKRLLPQGT